MGKRNFIVLYTLLMLVVPFYGKTQEVRKGDVNLGIAMGPAANFYDYSSDMRPGFYGYIEQGFWKQGQERLLWVQKVVFSFLHHEGGDYKYDWTNFFLLARGSYHYYIKPVHLDVMLVLPVDLVLPLFLTNITIAFIRIHRIITL